MQIAAHRLLRIGCGLELFEIGCRQLPDRRLVVFQTPVIALRLHAGASGEAHVLEPGRRPPIHIRRRRPVPGPEVHGDEELGDEVLRDLGEHVGLGRRFQLVAERIRKERLQPVRDLDLEQVLLLAVEIQDAAAGAGAADLPELEEVHRDLLDRPIRRQAPQENQRVLDARPLLGELEAHLEREVVAVVIRLVDEDVPGTLDSPGTTVNDHPSRQARQEETDGRQQDDWADAPPGHRRGRAAITGRRRGRDGRSSGR